MKNLFVILFFLSIITVSCGSNDVSTATDTDNTVDTTPTVDEDSADEVDKESEDEDVVVVVDQDEVEVSDEDVAVEPHNIGHTTLNLQDSQYGANGFPVEIYYPTTETALEDAPVSDGVFPVLIFGHGYQEGYGDYKYIQDAFVPLGYVVVFPNKLSIQATINVDEYTTDLNYLLDKMQELGGDNASLFNAHISPKSALLGHSTGAGVCFNAAATPATNPATTIVSLAPLGNLDDSQPINGVWPINAATSVTLPTLIVDGAEDCITPPVMHSKPIFDNLPNSIEKYRATITSGDHCNFGNGTGPGFATCETAEYTYHHCYGGIPPVNTQGTTISANEQNTVILELIVPWINYYVKDSSTAWAQFETGLINSALSFEKGDE